MANLRAKVRWRASTATWCARSSRAARSRSCRAENRHRCSSRCSAYRSAGAKICSATACGRSSCAIAGRRDSWIRPLPGTCTCSRGSSASAPRVWIDALRERADAVWCYSTYLRDVYVASGISPDRVKVVPLGFDPLIDHRASNRWGYRTRTRACFCSSAGCRRARTSRCSSRRTCAPFVPVTRLRCCSRIRPQPGATSPAGRKNCARSPRAPTFRGSCTSTRRSPMPTWRGCTGLRRPSYTRTAAKASASPCSRRWRAVRR